MTLKKIIQNITRATALASLIGVGCSNYLKLEDFENSKWILYYNSNGFIWTPYMNEQIRHNQHNWAIYQSIVSQKNGNNLEGWIELPDLDKNGKVGK